MTKTIDIATAETNLERAVIRMINDMAEDHSEGVAGAGRDLLAGGCAGWVAAGLYLTGVSERFAARHIKDILALWEDDTRDLGERPGPRGAALDLSWLAHYGFQAAARRVLDRAGIEY
jgi:hypothetical protein